MPNCKCLNCDHEMNISFTRGTEISKVWCPKCGKFGFKRWTEWTDLNGGIHH